MKQSIRYRLYNTMRKHGLCLDATKNPKVQKMLKTIHSLKGGKIIFEITKDKNGDWAAEATNLPGLITGGYATDDYNEMITDAIFTYFDISPAYCDDSLLINTKC